MKDQNQINLVGAYAGLLAITEVGLGSVLHAARVPLRGQFLSLNQIFLLMRASKEGGKNASRFSPAAISNAAAVLKSLSPAGNKLTPMLAIGMQGWLFTLGILFFGHSILGRLVGGILASYWAFAQPILLYGLIFGTGILTGSFKELSHLFPASERILLYCVGGLVFIKTLLVLAMAVKLPSSWVDKYFLKMARFTFSESKSPSSAALSAWKGALKQIFKPLFLFSIGLTALLLFFAEGSYASLIWHLLRPLACGFLLFYGLRWIPLEKIIPRLTKNSSGLFGQALAIALNRIRNYSNISSASPIDKTP